MNLPWFTADYTHPLMTFVQVLIDEQAKYGEGKDPDTTCHSCCGKSTAQHTCDDCSMIIHGIDPCNRATDKETKKECVGCYLRKNTSSSSPVATVPPIPPRGDPPADLEVEFYTKWRDMPPDERIAYIKGKKFYTDTRNSYYVLAHTKDEEMCTYHYFTIMMSKKTMSALQLGASIPGKHLPRK